MSFSIVSTRKRPVPPEHRSNFNNLVFDIAWFGVLNGSAIAFVAVYATRIGASAFQLSLMAALPAVVNLVVRAAGRALATGQAGRSGHRGDGHIVSGGST